MSEGEDSIATTCLSVVPISKKIRIWPNCYDVLKCDDIYLSFNYPAHLQALQSAAHQNHNEFSESVYIECL